MTTAGQHASTRAGPALREPDGGCRVALPARAAGQWCRLAVSVSPPQRWWAKVEVADPARGHVVREAFLGQAHRRCGRDWRAILLHLPAGSGSLVVRIFREDGSLDDAPLVKLRILTRSGAALRLLVGGWRAVPGALAGGLVGMQGRVRRVLGCGATRRGEAPPYAVWTRLYDRWNEAARAALAGGPPSGPSIGIAIIAGAAPDGAALLHMTMASIRSQWRPPAAVAMITDPAGCERLGTEWVLVVQAGEVLADHALAYFGHAVRGAPTALGFYADLDSLVDGQRTDPLFKPATADPWLLQTGLLTRGACLFHVSVAARVNAGLERLPDADTWRLALARSLPANAFQAVSFILTHIVPVPRAAGQKAGAPGCIPALRGDWPMVSVVVPSSCRARHALQCLRHLIAVTDYPAFEVLVAVAHIDPSDRIQAANLARLARLPRLRIVDLGMGLFNYACVNNAAVRHGRGELLLLLNDDVAPIHPDWLRRMVTSLEPPGGDEADILGVRLLYGNGTVQHGGAIMGLANLCEHAFRLTAGFDKGPHGLAGFDRQVSAVTAACMLVRRSLYEALGGMDEGFRIALNDVDFCLRAGAAGARVKFAGSIELYHFESLSLGRHYQGARAGLEAVEVRRLRERWSRVIAADPFYNPLASVEPGREFEPAFPPRQTGLSWIAGERLAQA